MSEVEQQITLDQAVQILCKELNYPAKRAMSFVKMFDHNGDGYLSVNELQKFKSQIAESKKTLESTFQKFDADGNGFVTLDEASEVLKAPPFKFPGEIVKELLKTFDKDGNGKLDYHEFAGFYAEAKASNDEISARFDQLDVDGNGVLSPEEVSEVLRERVGFDAKQVTELMKVFDTNNDGSLDKTEFMAMWNKMFGN